MNCPIIVPTAILAELDYLLGSRIGLTGQARMLETLATGAFTIEQFTKDDAVFCRNLMLKYPSLELGLADAAVVATAERLGIRTILTVDERDFRVVTNSQGLPFTLLPADNRPEATRRH